MAKTHINTQSGQASLKDHKHQLGFPVQIFVFFSFPLIYFLTASHFINVHTPRGMYKQAVEM